MNDSHDVRLDHQRRERIGLDEGIFCESKTVDQIQRIIDGAIDQGRTLLLTRLTADQYVQLSAAAIQNVDYDELSRTGFVGQIGPPIQSSVSAAIVTAGTSDARIAREAARTLEYHGINAEEFHDVGVAGLWRVLSIKNELRKHNVVIVVAGMDAALPSVIAGLIPAVVIAVPSSVGYGVSEGGRSALNSILSSCSPGLVAVNIDNGYGAACAAIRIAQCLKISVE